MLTMSGDDVLDRAGGDRAAAGDDAHRIGEADHVVHHVRGQHHGAAGVREGADEVAYPPPDGGVHPGRRLVQEDQLGAPHDGERERQALTLTAGEATHEGAGEVVDAEVLGDLVHVERVRMQARAVAQQLHRPGAGGQAAVLDHHADPRPVLGTGVPRVPSEHLHGAAARPQQPGRAGDGGGLARPVGAQQRGHLTAERSEREAVEGADRTVGVREVLDAQRRRGSARRSGDVVCHGDPIVGATSWVSRRARRTARRPTTGTGGGDAWRGWRERCEMGDRSAPAGFSDRRRAAGCGRGPRPRPRAGPGERCPHLPRCSWGSGHGRAHPAGAPGPGPAAPPGWG